MSESPETITVQVTRPPDTRAFLEARKAVASSLDVAPDDLSHVEVVRELAEAYTGNGGLGEWRDNS